MRLALNQFAMAFIAVTMVLTAAVGSKAEAREFATATARKKEIERKVGVLARMAFGLTSHKVKAEAGVDMVMGLAMHQAGYEADEKEEFLKSEGFNIDLPESKMEFSDMTTWGTLKADAAATLFTFNDDRDGETRKSRLRRTLGQTILEELNEIKGVSYGFTSGSSSYCGVSFMGLLIVDEESGIIYELSLTDGGSC